LRGRRFGGGIQPPQVAMLQDHGLNQAGELQDAPTRLTFEFKPDQEQLGDQGGPNLEQHGIPGGAVKSLDLQVLLDSLEKPLDLPAAAVELSHLQGGQIPAVGEKNLVLAGFRVAVVHPAQEFGKRGSARG
jgi:hypothetical protein